MSDSPLESPATSIPDRTATDSLVSVPLTDDFRFSMAHSQHDQPESDPPTPTPNEDEDEEVE